MSDAWIVLQEDEDGRVYLYDADSPEVWVPWPRDAKTFTNAAAKRVMRELGPRPGLKTVRRFEELARVS